MGAWRAKHFAFATENVPVWVEAAKRIYGTVGSRYGCAGYCFGAPFVTSLLAGDAVSAGAVAHPSQLKEEYLRAVKSAFLLFSSSLLGLISHLLMLILQSLFSSRAPRATASLAQSRAARPSISCRRPRRPTNFSCSTMSTTVLLRVAT